MEAVVSSQLSAVSSLLGCQNKRRLYLSVEGKQTAPTESCGTVYGYPTTQELATKFGAAGRSRTADKVLQALPSHLATAALTQTEGRSRAPWQPAASSAYSTNVLSPSRAVI